jgi:hypothetical protein
MYVELFINDTNFSNIDTIGSGRIFGNNAAINCKLPDSIDPYNKYYVRLIDSLNNPSEYFRLNINPAKVEITTEQSDLEILCSGVSFYIDYTIEGCFEIDNVFQIILSDVDGNFNTDDAIIIGDTTYNRSGRIYVHIPFDILVGNNYRLKITSTLPQLERILDFKITITQPYIYIVDSLSGLSECDPNPVLPKQIPILQQSNDSLIVKFIASECFGKENKFILQLGKVTSDEPTGDFTNPINVDTCA